MKIKIKISKQKKEDEMTINDREVDLTKATDEELAELLMAAEERIDELESEIENLEDAVDELEDACERIREEQAGREAQKTE